jgi:hypothetical protein
MVIYPNQGRDSSDGLSSALTRRRWSIATRHQGVDVARP